MRPIRMPGRGLTPILVLVIAVPPRVCTCDHDHTDPEPAPVACLADPADDHHHHDHDDDPDCPCLKPAQIKHTILAAGVEAPTPSTLSTALVAFADAPSASEAAAPVARRTGDPPLYLTNCALRC